VTVPREPTWDVLIVAAAKGRVEHGRQLRGELERLGLRVKLDLVPVPSVSNLPEEVAADARGAAVLVALIAVREMVGGELRESVGYLLASAPRRQEKRSVLEAAGLAPTENDVETGMIGGDLAGLAKRIEARVRRR
jgi:hypothetical protein